MGTEAEGPPASEPQGLPSSAKAGLVVFGLVVFGLLSFVYGAEVLFPLFGSDEAIQKLNIKQGTSGDGAPSVNATDVRERLPSLARVLDEMVRTGERFRSFPVNETTSRWCYELSEELGPCPSAFEYRGTPFRMYLVGE